MFALSVQDPTGAITDSRQFAEGSFVIGRTDRCDIVLDSTNVSREHARLYVQNGRCFVEDLGSANGVVVDGQKVVGQRDLGTASQIQIGDFFIFVETRATRDHLSPIAQTLFISDDQGHNKLVRINDQFAGEEFSLSEVANTIGRTDENFILLSDPSISRDHAQVMRNGERYTVVDTGSSNGSKINGKKINGTAELKLGDRVQFGNVEFVFVSGDVRIDPSEYAGQPGNKYVMTVGAVILAGLIIAASIFLVVGFIGTSDKGADDKNVVTDDRTSELMARAQKKIDRRNFDSAVKILSDIVKHDSGNQKAKTLLKSAKIEQRGAEKLSAADRLIEVSSFDEAIALLEQVPEDSLAADRAAEQIGRVKKMHAHKLKSDGDRWAKSDAREELKKAHASYSRALELLPDDADIEKARRRLEKKMKKKKIEL